LGRVLAGGLGLKGSWARSVLLRVKGGCAKQGAWRVVIWRLRALMSLGSVARPERHDPLVRGDEPDKRRDLVRSEAPMSQVFRLHSARAY